MDINARYTFALDIVRKLSDYQMSFNAPELHIEKKNDLSPVTEVDKKSEMMFRKAVSKAFPEDVVFGEEHDGAENSSIRWVIDPIDGTRKFMRGLPFWGICIAFEVDGIVELGVIAVPGTGKVWSAMRGCGAWCDGKKINVDNSAKKIEDVFLTMPARPFFEGIGAHNIYDNLQGVIEHDTGFLDAYSYNMVADGRLHALVSCADKWWDIAAATVIVEEAGGRFTDIKGDLPCENEINIAASKATHEILLDYLQSFTAK